MFESIGGGNGKVTIDNGKLVRGPYTLEFCKELLRKLLETQQKVRLIGPDPNIELITHAELEEIRKIWRTERQDWADSVPKIYADVIGEHEWVVDDTISFSAADKTLLSSICNEKEIPVTLVAKIVGYGATDGRNESARKNSSLKLMQSSMKIGNQRKRSSLL